MAVIKDKNEPGRFLGEGVSFRAKLIGVLEVPEARGDRMCQEALADLKMAIRAAGEHKQRIQVHVAIDGLRLRDDKTGDSLYHHPVHKISFIAQDMTDSRAFGYIFGSPDTGHRFFGIKTDKAASQVVIAMRDLFQVVFELKKKEVEMAKQQLEGKTVTSSLVRHATNASTESKTKFRNLSQSITSVGETSSSTSKAADVGAEGGVAELVDLEQELSSLRRGLTQVEGLTPSNDPFGDSFTALPSQKGLLPPPPTGSSTRGRTTAAPTVPRGVFSPGKAAPALPFDLATVAAEFEPTPALVDNLNDTPELKNPPKKVLKDLVSTQSLISDILPVTTDTKIEHYGPATTMTSLSRHSGGSVAIVKPTQTALFTGNFFSSDPFAETDPFDNTDPFSDSFKDDPFTSMQDFPKASVLRVDELKSKLSKEDKEPLENGKSVFNGPLQVSLPPEPAPKSPRLQRQNTESSSVRQRPQAHKLSADGASPPPPLPPKKVGELPAARPPPRPPHDHDDEDVGPPLPKPAMRREPLADRSMKPRLSSAATNSSEDEYLTPAPPPLPTARRFDITLSQLLTCTMDELAHRLRVPATTLSSMTLPQLTDYLRSYLAADNDRAHIHVESTSKTEKEKPITAVSGLSTPSGILDKPVHNDFKPQFEDNFTPPAETSDTFVANFDDFDKKANPSYDRYAAFREIQEEELKAKSILDPIDALESEPKQDSDEKELTAIENLIRANQDREHETKEPARSPLKTLDELTLDSFNMFRNSVSPKPSQIDAKIEDIKSVMKTLQIEKSRRSVSPRDNGHVDVKHEDTNDRYAALREITITEPPQDEFESLPPELPKERKRSDEKSDGFDNSDFFDCIDNSSLSFTHVEDAFRKSPIVKETEDKKLEEIKEPPVEIVPLPVRDLAPPTRLSTGSISDVVSGSSPDTKEKLGGGAGVSGGGAARGGRWAVLGGARCLRPPSDRVRVRAGDWRMRPPRHPRPRQGPIPRLRMRRPRHHDPPARAPIVQTSSSSRDVSPWDEELPPVTRLQRPPSHRDRDSRHNSSGSRECLDSGSGREKDKLRDKRDMRDRERDMSRDGRDSARDRRDSARDSGSGRDRRDVSKERDHRDHRDRRDRRSRDRENDSWDRDRTYSREREYRDSRSRERLPKDYRDKDRDRHRKPRHSYDEDEDYSDGCGSGRSSPRDRWPDQRWRRDERNYGSLGWRETRRRAELRQSEDSSERRYGSTLGWSTRRTTPRRDSSRERDSSRDVRESRDVRDGRDVRDSRRRVRRDDARRPRDYRFSNDFSPRERDAEPFDNDFQDTPTPTGKKRAPYSSLEGTRFAFEPEDATASPASVSSARARDSEASAARFRFDSDSVSPRSLFEDDFAAPRPRTASIAEEDELPPLRPRGPPAPRDIRKSDSINIFTRDADPFEGDAFFACTGSDRAARRENWPGDFQGFDNA
uniref:PID domain-containing protein n=1 Tax=Heliothis virescens TaxID=7102 RepID=A0A2A4K9N5_HELVI